MKLSMRTRLRRIRNRIRSPGARGLILMYHRIAEDPDDPWGNCVTPDHFREHLEVVRAVARPMPLATLIRSAMNGTLKDGSIAITFDDGYADNITRGVPLLETQDLSATLFLTTFFLPHPVASEPAGQGHLFWWERLAETVCRSSRMPEFLHLEVGGMEHEWPVPRSPGAPRRELAREIHGRLLPLPIGEKLDALETLQAQLPPGAAAGPVPHTLSPSQAREIAGHPLIEIGGHTVSHPDLTTLTDSELTREVSGCRDHLANWLDRTPSGFSYPHGRLDDRVVDAVVDAGFEHACTSDRAPVRSGRHPFRLPRHYVADQDGDAFSREIRWLLY